MVFRQYLPYAFSPPEKIEWRNIEELDDIWGFYLNYEVEVSFERQEGLAISSLERIRPVE